MSVLTPKADMFSFGINVRYVPKADAMLDRVGLRTASY